MKNKEWLISNPIVANKLGPEGAKYLSDALKRNTTLCKLNLRGTCDYESYSSHELTPTINKHKANDIQANGVKYLSESLQYNSTLTSLDLRGAQS